jgi:hypothetical protein
VVIDCERVVVYEAGVALYTVGVRKAFDVAHDEIDKAVPFAAHARHDFTSVHADAVDVHAEALRGLCCVRGLRRRDQQFAGHAAHARARRAIHAAFDDGDRSPGRLGCTVRNKARCA